MQKIIITGGAGFIGSHLIDRLLSQYCIINVDDFNNYYDPKIKKRNIENHLKHKNYKLYKIDIRDKKGLENVFEKEKPEKIIHLAARAGVRASLENPSLYLEVNFWGTKNLLDLAVKYKLNQFIFGSSSSVYGNTKRVPFSENNRNLEPISPYGKSKLEAESLCADYFKKYGLPATLLRFFTVYGPRGRPDMAPFLFTKSIIEGTPIKKFGKGNSKRDYTYVDDIVEGINLALNQVLEFEIINLGNSNPVVLNDFISILEKLIGKKAKVITEKNQLGDVKKTFASIEKAKKLLGWQPKVNFETGLENFVRWFRINVKIKK